MRATRLEERGAVPPELRGRWLILWDGECGFCRRVVETVLRWSDPGRLVARPYQACADWLPEPVLRLSPRQAHLRSPEGAYWGGGAAVTRMIGLLGWRRLERCLDAPPLRPAVAWGYRWVAAHRRWLGRWIYRCR